MHTTFQNLGLKQQVLQAIQELGFETPTPIQEKAIPYLLESRNDLVAFAQTGTGKTAAFGLPIIEQIDLANPKVQMLALCPTRELCLQISKELTNYAKYLTGLHVVSVYGGAEISKQITALKQGAHIVVGTPGRALDLINRGKLQIEHIRWLVLDEADEMLSMGFKDELDAILGSTPATKQTLLFSATMPEEMTAIAQKYMHHPAEISAGKKNIGAENVQHHFYLIHAKDKYLALKRVADYYPDIYGIVFCRTRVETKEIADKLMEDGYNADALHGDLSQAQRDYVMQRFRLKQIQILVATDVAARGLDVNNLSHVINYSLPDDPEVYIHRSGRTGRAGKSGISIILANMREKSKLSFIEKKISKRFEQKTVPTGREICEKQLFHMIDRIENIEIKDTQIEQYLPSIYARLSWMSREDLLQRFVSIEFNHFLSYYKNAPDLNAGVIPVREERQEKGKRAEPRASSVPFAKLFFNIGKKDQISAKHLIELINRHTKGKSVRIGRIELTRNFSLVEVEETYQDAVIQALKGAAYNGFPLEVRLDRKK
ncbi:MAG: DEAD/DEAH box helicase [Haliscomenobacter sp.]|nr:DEAD/DEAH box helicase [Haliscomenobacter sp.]